MPKSLNEEIGRVSNDALPPLRSLKAVEDYIESLDVSFADYMGFSLVPLLEAILKDPALTTDCRKLAAIIGRGGTNFTKISRKARDPRQAEEFFRKMAAKLDELKVSAKLEAPYLVKHMGLAFPDVIFYSQVSSGQTIALFGSPVIFLLNLSPAVQRYMSHLATHTYKGGKETREDIQRDLVGRMNAAQRLKEYKSLLATIENCEAAVLSLLRSGVAFVNSEKVPVPDEVKAFFGI